MEYILITGGASGMGRATAIKFAQQGYYVFSCDIKTSGEQVENIEEIILDVRDLASIERAKDIIKTKTDCLCAILNFAGIVMMDSLIEMKESDFVKMFDINVTGAFRVNKVFFPFLKQGKGKILITTSELAPNKILPFNAIYGITKKALDAYAEGLRMEVGLLGIQVVTLRPGAVKTPLLDDSTKSMNELKYSTLLYKNNTSKFKKIVESQQGSTISPEKIANLVYKIINKKNPKFVYTINASFKLKLLNLVPAKLQLKIFKKLLN